MTITRSVKERHPYHYHPGFKLVTSEKQDVVNPILKGLKTLIKTTRSGLLKLKAKLADANPVLKKDGSPRKNSVHHNLKKEIFEKEVLLGDMREKAGKEPARVNTSDIEDYREYKQIDNEGKKLVTIQRIPQNMGKLGSVTVQKCPGSFRRVAVVYDFVHEAIRPDENGCC